MNNIYHYFLNNQSFDQLKPDKNDFISLATVKLSLALKNKLIFEEAIDYANQIKAEHQDNNILGIFFITWAQLLWKENKIPEAYALISRCKSIWQDIGNEIKAQVFIIEGLLASKKGDKKSREQLGLKALDLLPFDSKRRPNACMSYSYFMAQQGKGTLIKNHIDYLSDLPQEVLPSAMLALIQFTDCIGTGRIKEALKWQKLIEEDVGILDTYSFAKKNYRTHIVMLEVMQGDWDLDESLETSADETFHSAKTIKALLARCPAKGLKLAKEYMSEYLLRDNAISGIGIESYNLLRAELSSGHMQAAKRILELRHERGNHHYLDHFFQSRIELLNNNFKVAKKYFKSALTEAKEFDALGRLDFEIRMSCEIPLGKLLDLFEQSSGELKKHPSTSTLTSQEKLKGLSRIIGESNQMRTIKETVKNYANLDIPVLITGETGTGKEVIAHALHELSDRRNKPFIAVNCGAIADSLLESELYGHHKGAFTGATHTHKGYFETAGDGTLFLDEIGTITPRLQISLLRVLETGEFRPIGDEKTGKANCRILFATNADLEKDVEEGKFRKDLYFRLRRLEIGLLPLRNRPSDIIPLADHFLNIGRNPEEHAYMASQLQNNLLNYPWPGNIRELQNTIENMRLLNSDKLTYLQEDIELKNRSSGNTPPKSIENIISSNHLPTFQVQSNSMVFGNTMIRKEQSIKALFEEHSILTRAEISKALNLTPKTVTGYLKKLCEDQFIKKIMPSKSPKSHYFKKT